MAKRPTRSNHAVGTLPFGAAQLRRIEPFGPYDPKIKSDDVVAVAGDRDEQDGVAPIYGDKRVQTLVGDDDAGTEIAKR
jgi:hypothetical protein